jgi:hypothetical protein
MLVLNFKNLSLFQSKLTKYFLRDIKNLIHYQKWLNYYQLVKS